MATMLRVIEGGRKPLDQIRQFIVDVERRARRDYPQLLAAAVRAARRVLNLRRDMNVRDVYAEQAPQFCAAHGISRSTYFALLADVKQSEARG